MEFFRKILQATQPSWNIFCFLLLKVSLQDICTFDEREEVGMSRGVYVNSSIKKVKTQQTIFILFTRLFYNHLTSEHNIRDHVTRSCWYGTCFFTWAPSTMNGFVYIDATNPKFKKTTTQFPESSHMHPPSQLKDCKCTCEAGEWLPPNCQAQRNWILRVPTRLVKFHNKLLKSHFRCFETESQWAKSSGTDSVRQI